MMIIEESPLNHETGGGERRLESELTPEERRSLSSHTLNFQMVLSTLSGSEADYGDAHRLACAELGIISAENEKKMRTLDSESSQ